MFRISKLFTINMISQPIWLRTDKKALQHLALRTTKLYSLQPCQVYHHLYKNDEAIQ